MTATKRVAYQRFNFPGGEEGHLLFDIGNRQGESGPAKDAEVVIREDGTVEGWVRTLPVYSDKYAWNTDSREAVPEELQIRAKEEDSLRFLLPADTLRKLHLIIVLIEIEYIAFVFELIQFSLEEFCQSVEQHMLSSFE